MNVSNYLFILDVLVIIVLSHGWVRGHSQSSRPWTRLSGSVKWHTRSPQPSWAREQLHSVTFLSNLMEPRSWLHNRILTKTTSGWAAPKEESWSATEGLKSCFPSRGAAQELQVHTGQCLSWRRESRLQPLLSPAITAWEIKNHISVLLLKKMHQSKPYSYYLHRSNFSSCLCKGRNTYRS